MKVRKHKFEEIAIAIEEQIKQELYKTGQRLPSIRTLKNRYSTSISTIQRAYEQLFIKDLITSKAKSGYFVKEKPNAGAGQAASPFKPVIVRDAVFQNNLTKITSQREVQSGLSEFNVAQTGDFFIPHKLILRSMQQVIREKGASLLRYYPPNGSDELRNHIARRVAFHQTTLNAAEVIITDGALQAFYIALASVCVPGDIVAVESPCIFSILEVIRTQKLKVVEIPVAIDHGLDLDYLHKVCQTTAIKAVVVTPNFHNPTGSFLTDDQKKRLLEITCANGIPVIENDTYGDLHYEEKRPSNLKSFDQSGYVLTYTSYSKSLASGIRLGWLSPGRYFERAEQIKYALGSTVSPVYQETILKLLASTSYDRHLRLFRSQLARQADHTKKVLSTLFPPGTRISTPYGGSNIWVEMNNHIDMDIFYRSCESQGIRFTPGYTFTFSKAYNQHFRIVFSDKFSAHKLNALRTASEIAAGLLTRHG